MRDYALSKLFFDLQNPAIAVEFRADREKIFERYSIPEDVRSRIRENDVPFLAERTNAYLLRYFFFTTGMKDDEFIRRLQEGPPRQMPRGKANG